MALPPIEDIARALLGEPSPELSIDSDLWFGEKLLVDVKLQAFSDYSTEPETRGDALALVGHIKKLAAGPARAWIYEAFPASAADPPIDPVPAALPEIEIERALLGILLAHPDWVDLLEEDVGAVDFIHPAHAGLFSVLRDASANDWRADVKTLVAAMGGDAGAEIFPGFPLSRYLAHLIASVATEFSDVSLQAHARDLAKEIRKLADAERGQEPEPEPAPFKSAFGLVMWADQDHPITDEYEYIVEDLIPEAQPILLIGESQTGKSYLSADLAISGARGIPFFGHRILKPFGSIVCAYESGKGYVNRMRGYRKFYGLDANDMPFGVLTHPIDLWSQEINTDKLIEEILRVADHRMRGHQLGLIVIDTHNAATPGASEIDSEAVSKIRDRYLRIIEKTKASVLIVGHKNASGKHRGSELLYNNIETALDISRRATQPSGRAAKPEPILDDNGRPIRRLTVVKQREGRDGQHFDFVLKGIQSGGIDRFGKPRTACVVLPPEQQPEQQAADAQSGGKVSAFGFRLNDNDVTFFKALQKALGEVGKPPPAALRLPTSIKLVVASTDVGKFYRDMVPNDEGQDEEGKKRYQNKIKSLIKNSRTKLSNNRAIGVLKSDISGIEQWLIWPTGRRVVGPGLMWPPSPHIVSDEPERAPPPQDEPAAEDSDAGHDDDDMDKPF